MVISVRLSISLIIISISSALDTNLAQQIGSAGCGKHTNLDPGFVETLTINITDANFNLTREYTVNLPTNYDIHTPTEMVFYFHGQGGSWPWTKWNTVSNDEGVIVVQPAGLPEQIGTRAWNTGLNDQGLKVANSTCYPQTEATCYDTCIQLNTCSQCAWATCADDGLFIEKLMEQMMDDFCIDTFSGVLANGPSNGSMFTYYLTSRFPNMFSAVVPVYGQPLINTLSVPDSLATVDIMHIHDRSDKTIPPSGVSEDGWIYMSVNTTLEEWARQKRCPIQMGFSNFTTPYSGGALNLECYHKPNCTLSQVFLCWWDGEHGSWDDNTEALALWFYRGKYRDYAPIELNKVLDIPSLRVRDDSN